MNFLLGRPIIRGELLVSGRVSTLLGEIGSNTLSFHRGGAHFQAMERFPLTASWREWREVCPRKGTAYLKDPGHLAI